MLVGETAPYWETHRLAAIPRQFRLRIGELAGAHLLEADSTQPQRTVREVSERLAASEAVQVISPTFVEQYASSVPDTPGTRIVMDHAVLEAAAGAGNGASAQFEHIRFRVTDVQFALGVTDGGLLLSLPTLDGEYDARAEIIAESDEALEWGRDLFEAVWADATPLAEVQETTAD